MSDRPRLGGLAGLRAGRDMDEPDDFAYGTCVCDKPGCHSERHQKCTRCGQLFNGTTIGDAHLVKKHPPAGYTQGGTGIYAGCPCERGLDYHHYCLNTTTMRERGWWQDEYHVWHQPQPTTPIRRTDA